MTHSRWLVPASAGVVLYALVELLNAAPPIANAGPDQLDVSMGNPIALDGTASSDAAGRPLTFAWQFVARPAGSAATLLNPASATPSFTPDRNGRYEVRLTVRAGREAATDTVVVVTKNRAPAADAGGDTGAPVGKRVRLRGAGTDPDLDKLTFFWTLIAKPGSSRAAIVSPTKASTVLTLDRPGTYVAQLQVTDPFGASAVDTVAITHVNSAPIAAAGTDFDVPVGTVVTLDASASTDVDEDPLTYTWTLVKPRGSAASISDPDALRPSLTLDVAGTYTAQLVAHDGSLASRVDAVAITTTPINARPVANAGPDQRIAVGQTCHLDASRSHDPNNQSVSYAWTLSKTPRDSVAALSSTAVRPTFVADVAGVYVAKLIVTDSAGRSSAADTVVLTTGNVAPIANAGDDRVAAVGASVQLRGSGSTDVDGDELAFGWALLHAPAGSAATLSDAEAVNPTFVPDVAGTYQFQLIVNDGVVSGVPDTVIITTENVRPRAAAGPDQTVSVGSPVGLDGGASSDANGDPLVFSWTLAARPAGSAATLSDSASPAPSFVADVAGDYVAQLRVSDGVVWSAQDAVVITTGNSVPVAEAGPDEIVAIGPVALDGGGSSDADGDPLTYRWSFVARPGGSAAVLSSASAVSPVFTADRTGTYVIQLIVDDGARQSAPATVLVIASGAPVDRPPTAVLEISPASIQVGAGAATLDFSSSFDPDAGDSIASYRVTLTTAPPGSQGGRSPGQQFAVGVPLLTSSSSLLFAPDVAGTYRFELVARDSRGMESVPAASELRATEPTTGTVAKVTIEPSSVFLTSIGQATTLAAHVIDDQGLPVDVPVSWSSSHPDQVSVDAQGRLAALSIGSAVIVAEAAGHRSTPALVVVAEPKPGALLLSDSQIVAITPPTLPAGEAPGIGTRYDVTLRGIGSAPLSGTVVLGTQSSPLAGKVVSSRQAGDTFVVTLEYAALYELLDRYRINWTIDLQDFPLVPVESAAARAPQGGVRAAELGTPFTEFKCDGKAELSLAKAEINLTPDVNLKLIVEDIRLDPAQPPTYSKHAVTGSETLTGKVGLEFKPGVEISGTCTADAIFRIPIGGPIALLIMPAVRFGLGVKVGGSVSLIEAELSATGKVGSSQTLGWECGGTTPECRSLDDISPINEFEFKSVDESLLGMHVDVSGHFFVHLGLDAVFLAVQNVPIIEARIGPKQSLDLAAEDDQANNRSYSSKYDLKLAGVVEPGAGLKEAIKRVIDDDSVSLSFKAAFESDLSKSPRGTFEVSKTRVALGDSVDFTVRLDPATLHYAVVGYNVDSVEVWRKKETDDEFQRFKSIPVTASGQSTFQLHWTPGPEDLGKAQYAAFVETVMPVFPILEVGDDTVKDIEVRCFTSGASAGAARSFGAMDTSVCADEWKGTASLVIVDSAETSASVTWTRDPDFDGGPGLVAYQPSGTVSFIYTAVERLGCSATPKTFTLAPTDGRLLVDYDVDPPMFLATGSFTADLTISCPDQDPSTVRVTFEWLNATGAVTDGGGTIAGSTSSPFGSSSFKFVRQ